MCFPIVIFYSLSWYFSEKEYSYKIEPELEFSYATEIQVQAGEQLPDVRLSDIYVELLEKNNLDEVYVINANKLDRKHIRLLWKL